LPPDVIGTCQTVQEEDRLTDLPQGKVFPIDAIHHQLLRGIALAEVQQGSRLSRIYPVIEASV